MTDLELMQLLEDEGYEATLENLQILKEGLERGEYMIEDATEDREPTELTSDIDNEDVYDDEEHEQEEDVGEVVVESFSDYELYQLLESEGYETTVENLEILKEGLESGEIEILTEVSTKEKAAIARRRDMNTAILYGLRSEKVEDPTLAKLINKEETEKRGKKIAKKIAQGYSVEKEIKKAKKIKQTNPTADFT